jgi:hypothetical protein
MACKQETEDRGTSALRLPESTRYVDIRDAYRHALWHRRPAAILAVFFASTIVLQGTVAFYRLFTGAQSRADLIIFGSGLFAGLALYTIVTDIAALAESSAAKSRRAFITIQIMGVQVHGNEYSGNVDWSSLKQVCFTSRALAIELPQRMIVVSLSDISNSELRRLRRLLITYHVCTCQRYEVA